jgi:hypothetical protein
MFRPDGSKSGIARDRRFSLRLQGRKIPRNGTIVRRSDCGRHRGQRVDSLEIVAGFVDFLLTFY